MSYVYFLLLQDRISEAITMYNTINKAKLAEDGCLVLQYDYMTAYLDFYINEENNYKLAREIVERYKEYPVLHWRYLFEEVREQLKEYDGDLELDKEIINQNEEEIKLNLKISKELEPLLHAELKGNRIQVDYENVESIEIKYYIIDPEILFSRTPFLAQDTEDFAFVMPSLVGSVILNSAQKNELIDIEKSLMNENMIIEVSGQGKQTFLRYFSTSLKVAINETYGELKVTNVKDSPLPLVYIKVFSKSKNGHIKFFRDGYTDLNGKYEYAQINSKSLSDIESFSIFVSSEEHGACTKECAPPQMIEVNEIDSWQANSIKFTKRMSRMSDNK